MVGMGADHRRAANAAFLRAELDWLSAAMSARFAAYAEGAGTAHLELAEPPQVDDTAAPYADFIREHALDGPERLIVALALAPHVAPALLDPFLLQNQATGRRFTEFGGVSANAHAGFLPTAETALFLLADGDPHERMKHERRLAREHRLVRQGIVVLDHRHPDEPPFSAALRLSAMAIHQLLNGSEHMPEPGPDFPAARITTPLDWGDLVLDAATLQQVEMIARWVQHSKTLMDEWGLSRRLKPGYRCLFHGPPGTGKTLTAGLLGKRFGVPVYRVDISMVMSKWIGETEKNLAALFDRAEGRGWILFFDEADSLFGKRTETRTANDRSANQQIAYLLQRIEDYSGLAILATNQRDFLDEAFARRFQSFIRFPVPDPKARLRLWRETFAGGGFTLSPDVHFKTIADKYELSGGAIINVLRHVCLMAVDRDPPVVQAEDLIDGIRRELQKDGHFVSG